MKFKTGFKMSNRHYIYADDFETFSANTKYFKENQDTNVYAISSKRVCVTYSFKEKKYVRIPDLNLTNLKLFCCVKISDYINHFNYSNRYGKYQIHYFHNGIKFDFHFILAWLIHEQKQFKYVFKIDKDEVVNEECWTCELNGNKFKLIKIFLKDKNNKGFITLEFRDSYRLFNFSIEKMSEELKKIDKIDIPKTELDVDLVQELPSNFYKLPDMIKKRVGNDSLILAKWLECRLSDGITFPLGSRIPFSSASNALNWYCNSLINKYGYTSKDKNLKKKVLYKELEVLDDKKREKLNLYFLEKRFYKGGISSFIPSIQNKILKEKITSYDVNSLYPFTASQDLPFGFPKKSKKILKNFNDYFVFVEVKFSKVKQIQRQVPAFLNMSWSIVDNKLANFNKTRNKLMRYYYDLDLNCHCLFSWEEFQVLNNKKWFDIEFKEIKYWYFKKKPILKDFMTENYEIKSTTKDSVIKASAKLKMNSLTGKFGEKPNHEKHILLLKDFPLTKEFLEANNILLNNEDDLNKKVDYSVYNHILATTIEWSNHTYLPIICAITSLGRAKLMKTALEETDKDKKRRWYYCDTDSGKTNFNLSPNLVDNDKLGFWKNEGSVEYFKVLRSKVYAGSDDMTTFKWLATSGVPNESIIKATNFKDLNLETEVDTRVAHKTKTHRVVILDTKKKISNFRQ